MYKCFFCDELLNEKNTSVEHIIPNSIGGRLKSKKILCKRCNSKLGEKFDSEISKMFNLTMLINNIKRDDGKTPRKEKIYKQKSENSKTGDGKAADKESGSKTGENTLIKEQKQEESKKEN